VVSPLDRRLAAIVRTQQRHLTALASQLADALTDTFLALPGVSDDDLDAWLADAVPLVLDMQEGAVTASYAYGNTIADMCRAAIAELPPPGAVVAAVRPDVTVADVYTRPIWVARNNIAALGLGAALAMGANRAAALGRTDVAAAARAGSAETRDATEGCTGYTRVTGGNACEFCLLLATTSFSVDEPAPAHTNCSCTEAPVIGRHDPGAVTRDDALGTLDMNPDEAATALDDMPVVETEVGPSTP
jgi:hypothetical protein